MAACWVIRASCPAPIMPTTGAPVRATSCVGRDVDGAHRKYSGRLTYVSDTNITPEACSRSGAEPTDESGRARSSGTTVITNARVVPLVEEQLALVVAAVTEP